MSQQDPNDPENPEGEGSELDDEDTQNDEENDEENDEDNTEDNDGEPSETEETEDSDSAISEDLSADQETPAEQFNVADPQDDPDPSPEDDPNPENPEDNSEDNQEDSDPDAAEHESRRKRSMLYVAGAAGMALLALGGFWLFSGGDAPTAPEPVAGEGLVTDPLAPLQSALNDILPPLITNSEAYLDFGDLPYTTGQVTKSIQISVRRSPVSFRLKAFNTEFPEEFSLTDGQCTVLQSLEPGETCTLEVLWEPQNPQSLDGTQLILEASYPASKQEEESLVWQPVEHLIPFRGQWNPAPAELDLDFPDLDFGEVPHTRLGETFTRRVQLTLRNRRILILSHVLDTTSDSESEGVSQRTDCPTEPPVPQDGTEYWCEFVVSWKPTTAGQKMSARILLDYQDLSTSDLGALQYRHTMSIAGSVALPEGVADKINLVTDPQITYGNVGIESRNKRIAIRNDGIPVQLGPFEIYSENAALVKDITVSSNCPNPEKEWFSPGSQCNLTVRWNTKQGPPLERFATELLIHYSSRTGNVIEGVPQVQRGNLTLPITGTPPASLDAAFQAPGTSGVSGISGVSGAPGGVPPRPVDANGNPILTPAELKQVLKAMAIQQWHQGRSQPTASGGDTVRMPPAPKSQGPDAVSQFRDRERERLEARRTGKLVSEDYSDLGLEPKDGVSSRPVDLSSVILAGRYIPIVFAQSVDSRAPTPVTAIISQSIYSNHGRNIVIPKGSRIIGRSLPASLPQNIVAAAGLLPGNKDSEGEGGNAASSQLVTGSPGTAYEGRLQMEWDRIILPNGTVFRPGNKFATTDIQGVLGVPGHFDRKELQRFLTTIANIGTQAAITWALGQDIWRQTTTTADGTTTTDFPNDPGDPETVTDGENNTTASISTVKITPKSQARTQFLEAATAELRRTLSGTLPPRPQLFVPVGTTALVIPQEDLWLQPATGHLSDLVRDSEDPQAIRTGSPEIKEIKEPGSGFSESPLPATGTKDPARRPATLSTVVPVVSVPEGPTGGGSGSYGSYGTSGAFSSQPARQSNSRSRLLPIVAPLLEPDSNPPPPYNPEYPEENFLQSPPQAPVPVPTQSPSQSPSQSIIVPGAG